jgi:hypothetical protein
MDHRWRQQAQAPVVVLVVLPVEEPFAELQAVLEAGEAVGELRPVLQRLELALREGVVVGDVRPTLRRTAAAGASPGPLGRPSVYICRPLVLPTPPRPRWWCAELRSGYALPSFRPPPPLDPSPKSLPFPSFYLLALYCNLSGRSCLTYYWHIDRRCGEDLGGTGPGGGPGGNWGPWVPRAILQPAFV